MKRKRTAERTGWLLGNLSRALGADVVSLYAAMKSNQAHAEAIKRGARKGKKT